MAHSDIVITGLGIVSALGLGREDFWNSLCARRSAIRSLADRDDDSAKPDVSSQSDPFWFGAPILGFDPKQYVRPRKALKVMCREIQTAFAASDLAIHDAGLSDHLPADVEGLISPDRLGTVFGSEMFYGPPKEMVTALKACIDDDGNVDPSRFGGAAMKGVMPLWMLKYLPNMPACQVGISVNAHGPNNSVVLGDVSGPAALIESVSCIRRGHADLMISGAAGTRINTTRLNYRLDYPANQAIPGSDRISPGDSGVVGGEGSVAMMLESAALAKQRSANAIACWRGHASRFHASGAMRRHDRSGHLDRHDRGSSTAVAHAIRAALTDAGIHASEVGFVVSHAMGDPAMDAAEKQASTEVFGNIPSIAPMTWLGHTGAASGVFALATGVCVLERLVDQRDSIDSLPWQTDVDNVDATLRQKPVGICLSHTSEGSATAIILGVPEG